MDKIKRNGVNTISTNNLINGIYFVNLINENGIVKTQKLVIVK
jgi:hypothetical protein